MTFWKQFLKYYFSAASGYIKNNTSEIYDTLICNSLQQSTRSHVRCKIASGKEVFINNAARAFSNDWLIDWFWHVNDSKIILWLEVKGLLSFYIYIQLFLQFFLKWVLVGTYVYDINYFNQIQIIFLYLYGF